MKLAFIIADAFEKFCRQQEITSEQFKTDIEPAFIGGFVAGLAHAKKETTDE